MYRIPIVFFTALALGAALAVISNAAGWGFETTWLVTVGVLAVLLAIGLPWAIPHDHRLDEQRKHHSL